MERRKFLGISSALVAGGLAGCTSVIDGEVNAEAELARVTDEELYMEETIEQFSVEETTSVFGRDVTASILSWLSEYRIVTGHPKHRIQQMVGGCFVISSPDYSVLGESVNPITFLDDEEFIELIESEADNISFEDIERKERTEEVTLLDEEIELNLFEGVVDEGGFESEMVVFTGRLVHEDDLIMLVGYQDDLTDGETFELMDDNEENGVLMRELVELIDGVEHPVDPPDDFSEENEVNEV